MTEQDRTGPPAQADAAPDPNQIDDVDDQAGEATPPSETEAPVEMQGYRIVEAILFAADTPMPGAKIAAVLGVGDARDIRRHIKKLNDEYAAGGLSFRIEEIAGGYRMLTLPAYNVWLTKLLRTRQETKLSPAALETLAIVAYKQPCTRADIETIRGVAAGDLLSRLREMNLVKIVGRAEDLGRPLLYGTTRRFLEVFGLPSLEDLPQVEALGGLSDAAAPKPPRPAASGEPPDDTNRDVEEADTRPDAGAAVESPTPGPTAEACPEDVAAQEGQKEGLEIDPEGRTTEE